VSTPVYLRITEAEFHGKVELLEALLSECRLCPRECRIDRSAGELGFCRTGSSAVVSSWGPHFGEERPLVGYGGSGTIFFTHCNLGCLFCQNYSISHLSEGSEMESDELAGVMLDLQGMGCHNINLVTPTHQTPMIFKAVLTARDRGLAIPIVYNTGGYESVEVLRLLEGLVDIYMPDFKYSDPEMAERYSEAPDYPVVVKEALREMHRQVGDLLLDHRGIAIRGLLVRHLVMPEGIAGTEKMAGFIAEEISRETYVNIMDQYHPCYRAFEMPPLDRRITGKEYNEAIETAKRLRLKRIDGITV
jgi:putative pyruvate formate lyase activating enzyme